jgi:hypothetical protein
LNELLDVSTLAAHVHSSSASAATSPAISRLSPERQIIFMLHIAPNQTEHTKEKCTLTIKSPSFSQLLKLCERKGARSLMSICLPDVHAPPRTLRQQVRAATVLPP